MAKANFVRVETTAQRGPAIPFSTSVGTPPVAPLFGVTPWQISAVFSTVISKTLPSASAGQISTQSFSVPLSSFPATMTLLTGTTATVVPSVSTGSVPSNILIGMPQIALTFGGPLGASSTFTLQAGRTYTGATMTVTFPVYYISAQINPFAVQFAVSATLFSQQATS